MSVSRRTGVVGMVIGAALLAAGVFAFFFPIFLTQRALTHSLDITVRHQELSTGVVSWLIGAPVGVVTGGFGALIFLLSLIIYFDAKGKEMPNDLTNQSS